MIDAKESNSKEHHQETMSTSKSFPVIMCFVVYLFLYDKNVILSVSLSKY